MVRVQTAALDPGALLGEFCAGRTDCGGVVSFTGLARAATDGAAVSVLELDAFPGFTEPAIEALVQTARVRFGVRDTMAVHRYGAIRPGEAIVFVAVAAEHRRAAFLAADFLMDKLKTEAPFWKKETGPEGERWIEPRAPDYQDAERWSEDI
ncbi:MAG TPA: molybdenum cofactor biosynthesis protein MoaE [Caulobacteraceae bacterium]|nr:molybdenum cofactor biosynthesis protein MoaE [Caulobacteraceae bacterium]